MNSDNSYLIIRKKTEGTLSDVLESIKEHGYNRIPVLLSNKHVSNVIIISTDNKIVGTAKIKGIEFDSKDDYAYKYHFVLEESHDKTFNDLIGEKINHLSYLPYQILSMNNILGRIKTNK